MRDPEQVRMHVRDAGGRLPPLDETEAIPAAAVNQLNAVLNSCFQRDPPKRPSASSVAAGLREAVHLCGQRRE